MIKIICFAALLIKSLAFAETRINVCCPPGLLVYDEDWGYTDVRSNAHLFWWLYKANSNSDNFNPNRPLLLWLQGGPGSSGVGFGNFDEIGPLDVNLQPRNVTWLQKGDLVFIDNPVGTGYSYVDRSSGYTTNVDGIAADLVTWAKEFFNTKHPEYQTRPFYIFCESYGGKMTTAFAWALYQAIQSGAVRSNFKGIALGDSWISPIDFVLSWPPYLYYQSILDGNQLQEANAQMQQCKALVDSGHWSQATDCWGNAENLISQLSSDVSWYNIMKTSNTDAWSKSGKKKRAMTPIERRVYYDFDYYDDLSNLLNGDAMRAKLGIIPDSVQWGAQDGNVFTYQYGDFMKPVVDTVDKLLMQTNLNVTIYEGQWDLICDAFGADSWISKLKWPSLSKFLSASRNPFPEMMDKNQIAGYFKRYKSLAYFWILRAGHMAPYDAPYASLHMVDRVINDFN